MSFGISFFGHIDPPNSDTDATIRKLARAFSDALRAAGIEHTGQVYTPSINGGNPLDLMDTGPLILVEGKGLATGTIHTSSASPTGAHKKP